MNATGTASGRAGVASGRTAVTVAAPVLFLVALVGVWWAATALLEVHAFVLPSPQQVAAVFTERTDYLYRSSRITAGEAISGYLLAVGIGVTLGGLLAAWQPLARIALPLLIGLDAIPKLALAPVLVVGIGFGTPTKVLIVVLTCLLPIVLSTVTGLTRTPAELVELARSLDGSWWKTLRKVRLPAALPRILMGIKVAAPLAVIGAVIGEFFGSASGLGYAIRAAGADTAVVYAALLLLAAMSLAIYYTVVAAELLLLRWAKETTA